MQKQEGGQWAPVAYYSQSTNRAEANYHSFKLEMLAIVKSIEKFHIYLYGLEFTVLSDCNTVVYAVSKASLNPRIARWILALQNYKFKISHRIDTRMNHVDALSRCVAYANFLPLERELEFIQLRDDRICHIANELEYQDNEKFKLIDGFIYRKCEDCDRFVIPESVIYSVVKHYHDDMAHCSIDKTFEGIHATYWFFSICKKIRNYIGNCIKCLIANSSNHAREGEMQITSNPTKPFEIIHLDN